MQAQSPAKGIKDHSNYRGEAELHTGDLNNGIETRLKNKRNYLHVKLFFLRFIYPILTLR